MEFCDLEPTERANGLASNKDDEGEVHARGYTPIQPALP